MLRLLANAASKCAGIHYERNGEQSKYKKFTAGMLVLCYVATILIYFRKKNNNDKKRDVYVSQIVQFPSPSFTIYWRVCYYF